MSPNKPYQGGTAQNPDVFFQNREAANKYYENAFDIIQQTMQDVGKIIGRDYQPFTYYGDADAENVIVIMGSGAETCQDTISTIIEENRKEFGKIGVLKVSIYRPFNTLSFLKTLPKTTKKLAVLDRTKESGAIGEPLYMDVLSAVAENKRNIDVYGGRYGLGSKIYPIALCNIRKSYEKNPLNHFTVGIEDDITSLSLKLDTKLMNYIINKSDKAYELIFYGLGSDGTNGHEIV